MSDYEEEDEKWIQWFCSLSGNEHFCEVAQSYIEDSFNLYGLRAVVPNYQEALNIILDMTDIPYDDDVPAYAAELYGLIHARYILTSHGLDAMMKKYREGDFGVCPRALCDGQPVVPAGLHDEWKKSEMKVFCPKCRDLYTPQTDYQTPAIDGAYFGTTFPHLFFLTYKELEPTPSTLLYVPRVFGYKIHNKAENRRRLAVLAKEDEDEEKTQQLQQEHAKSFIVDNRTHKLLLYLSEILFNSSSAVDDVANDVNEHLQLQQKQPISQWEDVTELLGMAAKELKVGQMVHLQDFNLFDSMSALELMDPKMDAGMLVNGAPPQPIASRMRNGLIAFEFTSARDVLATIDELFRCESGWINGQPLPQTLLTCVYMHKEPISVLVGRLVSFDDLAAVTDMREILQTRLTKSAKDTLRLVMTVFCFVLMKTGNLIRDVVVRGDIYEEEDFTPGNGLDLGILDAYPSDSVDALLHATEERLQTLLDEQKAAAASKKSSKKKGGKKNSSSGSATSSAPSDHSEESYEALHPNPRVSVLICEALLLRIRLRKQFYLAYSGLGLAEGQIDLARGRKQFNSALDVLTQISTEQLERDPECFGGKPIGFDKTLSRLLLSGSPPRDVKIPTLDESVEIQKSLMRHLITACSPAEWSCMEELRIFLTDFASQHPNIVARSYALLFLYADKKIYAKFNFMEWLTAAMTMNGVPAVLLSTQEGVMFASRSIETVYESLKVYLLNQSRQRARIEYLLEEWAVLQLEASGVDEKFTTEMAIPKAAYPRYFTAWTLEETILLMLHYIGLGLELDLYSPSEYGTIYWYLDYLLGSRLQNLKFTWSFVEKLTQMMPGHKSGPSSSASTSTADSAGGAPSTDGKHNKKGKSKHKKQHNAQTAAMAEPAAPVDPTKARFTREINYTEMLRSCMRAYFQLCSALERDGLISVGQPAFGSAAIRFEHRFGAFQSIHFPLPLTYEDFAKNSDFSPYEVDLIYKSAEECFKVARTRAEELLGDNEAVMWKTSDATIAPVRATEIESVMRVAITNCVNLARREKESHLSGASGSKSKKNQKNGAMSASPAIRSSTHMGFDFALHPLFPVVVFPEKRT